jgi:transcriptional regulator with GAF, ATPase, and Fis domain
MAPDRARAAAVRPTAANGTLAQVERVHLRQALQLCGWRIRGVGGAAERLGIKPTTLESRLKKLGIKRPHDASDIS